MHSLLLVECPRGRDPEYSGNVWRKVAPKRFSHQFGGIYFLSPIPETYWKRFMAVGFEIFKLTQPIPRLFIATPLI
jgi:hypothetical protein